MRGGSETKLFQPHLLHIYAQECSDVEKCFNEKWCEKQIEKATFTDILKWSMKTITN